MTQLSIEGTKFLINGNLTYSRIAGSDPRSHGMLMNARFIQGIFDDKNADNDYNRFGRTFDPERNTDELIAALPAWHEKGLRAFTIGIQGGGPCFTMANEAIDQNPFGPRGESLDAGHARRLRRLIEAADRIGMVVIVSLFYQGQSQRLEDGAAVLAAVRTACRFLKGTGFRNLIIEVANEHDSEDYLCHPLINTDEGMVALLELARSESGGIPVGCSGCGGYTSPEVWKAGDVIIIHGNDCSPQRVYEMIRMAGEHEPDKPVLFNEDSQSLSNFQAAVENGASWGYYNNLTKQEPPTDWSITDGEDEFFAERVAEFIGISRPSSDRRRNVVLQGTTPAEMTGGKAWPRVAALYPEEISRVDFFLDGVLSFRAYEAPFALYRVNNWLQEGMSVRGKAVKLTVEVFFHDGKTVMLEDVVSG